MKSVQFVRITSPLFRGSRIRNVLESTLPHVEQGLDKISRVIMKSSIEIDKNPLLATCCLINIKHNTKFDITLVT